MMFYMDSKVFQNDFLTNEYDDDILNAQYVIVSTRIRIRDREDFDNIIKATDDLFPDPEVCSAIDEEYFRERYFEQLNKSKTLLSYLIKGSIEEGYHIIFICTKNENKIKYLKLLSDYIYMEFCYPVYEYKSYSNGTSRLIKYDKNKILKICNELVKEANDKAFYEQLKTKDGLKSFHKDLKSLSKKSLKEELKKRDLYRKGMSKSEMIDMLEFYLLE